MALHLEDGALPVSDVYNAGVLSGALYDHFAGRGELSQMDSRALVGTVFGPHSGEDAKFGNVRLPAERIRNLFVFFFCEPVVKSGLQVGHIVSITLYNLIYQLFGV